ncbi:DUF2058 domain-containing protein [Frateuria sp. STR12]|uniref:DUF2058 domain-containing protein n=1 Tax=Frateuria hangzhouensis TaxID=2995589 RepID=UPI002260D18B|nr:DUF2058 family protein [Frateuria sp. STR12]MCX7514919.1 DUF2058 family protein [Frateuria sp. STR12]
MADSLRDQLLKSGIVKQVRDEQRPKPSSQPPRGNRPPQGKGKPQRPPTRRDQGEMDLAKAYAIRAQTEAAERKRADQEAAEQARLRRERKAKIQKLLEGQVLNKAEADHVRHFEYGGKIRRVHIDAEQLAALNEGRLGIVQQGGRYLLVSQAIAEQVRAIDPQQLALLVDPQAAIDDDGVPDDLMW